ncbi:MAG: hypothetical protein M3P39_07000 [Actinomycetota bacterium]|jgi:hypothetical protein|nr:hypothetical protein [Actinomycetota bacterium]
MADELRKSEMWRGIRRGAGFAFGIGAVVTAASLLRDGARPTVKGLMKAGMQGRTMAAELSEQLQDLYAEAAYEHQRPQEGPQEA